jgi:hypothetical protein
MLSPDADTPRTGSVLPVRPNVEDCYAREAIRQTLGLKLVCLLFHLTPGGFRAAYVTRVRIGNPFFSGNLRHLTTYSSMRKWQIPSRSHCSSSIRSPGIFVQQSPRSNRGLGYSLINDDRSLRNRRSLLRFVKILPVALGCLNNVRVTRETR